jgi:hypothetical protein
MKTYFPLRFSSVVLVVVMMTGFTSLSAQSTRPATFDAQTKVVTLDESVPFGYMYEIDVSSLSINTQKEVDSYFDKLETDLVTYVAKSARQVQIQLNMRQQPAWTATDWNKYLKSLEQK